jgi:hypothetical protein
MIAIDMVGHLEGFFDTLAYHEGAANVLCMADVKDMYDITYEAGHAITVHMDEEDLVFYRRNKIYVGDICVSGRLTERPLCPPWSPPSPTTRASSPQERAQAGEGGSEVHPGCGVPHPEGGCPPGRG